MSSLSATTARSVSMAPSIALATVSTPAPVSSAPWDALLETTCAHHIFEETARLAPNQVAIIADGRSFTYGEVNAHADKVAAELIARNLPLETPIGVYADRSPELLIAFVGILKAGCTYVPLDPLHPVERLQYMMDEMRAPVVLTEKREHSLSGSAAFISVADILAAPAKVLPPGAYPRAFTPDNLAYIIFTSGSTGKPKGTMLEHRGLVNFCYYFKTVHNYRLGERAAELVRPGFDASMSELAGMFFNGVTICIPSNDALNNPAKLVEFIVAQ